MTTADNITAEITGENALLLDALLLLTFGSPYEYEKRYRERDIYANVSNSGYWLPAAVMILKSIVVPAVQPGIPIRIQILS